VQLLQLLPLLLPLRPRPLGCLPERPLLLLQLLLLPPLLLLQALHEVLILAPNGVHAGAGRNRRATHPAGRHAILAQGGPHRRLAHARSAAAATSDARRTISERHLEHVQQRRVPFPGVADAAAATWRRARGHCSCHGIRLLAAVHDVLVLPRRRPLGPSGPVARAHRFHLRRRRRPVWRSKARAHRLHLRRRWHPARHQRLHRRRGPRRWRRPVRRQCLHLRRHRPLGHRRRPLWRQPLLRQQRRRHVPLHGHGPREPRGRHGQVHPLQERLLLRRLLRVAAGRWASCRCVRSCGPCMPGAVCRPMRRHLPWGRRCSGTAGRVDRHIRGSWDARPGHRPRGPHGRHVQVHPLREWRLLLLRVAIERRASGHRGVRRRCRRCWPADVCCPVRRNWPSRSRWSRGAAGRVSRRIRGKWSYGRVRTRC